MSNLSVHFSTGKDNWGTPPEVFKRYDDLFHFTIDGAADASNKMLPRYWGPESRECEDFLATGHDDWLGERVWLNPPYSRGAQADFVRHALRLTAGAKASVGLLLPARTDTILYHECIWDRDAQRPRPWVAYLDFIKGRVKFVGAAHGAPFPSMFVLFRGVQ